MVRCKSKWNVSLLKLQIATIHKLIAITPHLAISQTMRWLRLHPAQVHPLLTMRRREESSLESLSLSRAWQRTFWNYLASLSLLDRIRSSSRSSRSTRSHRTIRHLRPRTTLCKRLKASPQWSTISSHSYKAEPKNAIKWLRSLSGWRQRFSDYSWRNSLELEVVPQLNDSSSLRVIEVTI